MRASETVHAETAFAVDAPHYRVNFWVKTSGGAWSLDAFVLTEVASVTEAIAWAQERADGRRFELFAEVHAEPVEAFEVPRTSALIRLLGENPNAGEPVLIATFRKI